MKEGKSYGVDVYSFNVNTGLTIVRQNRYIRVRGLLVLQVGGFTLRREASTCYFLILIFFLVLYFNFKKVSGYWVKKCSSKWGGVNPT